MAGRLGEDCGRDRGDVPHVDLRDHCVAAWHGQHTLTCHRPGVRLEVLQVPVGRQHGVRNPAAAQRLDDLAVRPPEQVRRVRRGTDATPP